MTILQCKYGASFVLQTVNVRNDYVLTAKNPVSIINNFFIVTDNEMSLWHSYVPIKPACSHFQKTRGFKGYFAAPCKLLGTFSVLRLCTGYD